MKKIYIPLMLIMLAVSAHAQTSSVQRMTATIPFEFSVGKTTLPAGKYTITVLNPTSDRKPLQIRSVNGRSSAIVLTMTFRFRPSAASVCVKPWMPSLAIE